MHRLCVKRQAQDKLRTNDTPDEYRERRRATPPSDQFSKLGYSATRVIPRPNDRFRAASSRIDEVFPKMPFSCCGVRILEEH